MSKKIEEVFNMSSTSAPEHTTEEEIGFDIEKLQETIEASNTDKNKYLYLVEKIKTENKKIK